MCLVEGEDTRVRITYNCGLQNEARYIEYAHGGIDLGSRIDLNDLDKKFELLENDDDVSDYVYDPQKDAPAPRIWEEAKK